MISSGQLVGARKGETILVMERMSNSKTKTEKTKKFAEELLSVWGTIDFAILPPCDDIQAPPGSADSHNPKPVTGTGAAVSQLPSRAECISYNSYGLEEARYTGPSQQRKNPKQYPLTPMLSNHNIEGYS